MDVTEHRDLLGQRKAFQLGQTGERILDSGILRRSARAGGARMLVGSTAAGSAGTSAVDRAGGRPSDRSRTQIAGGQPSG